MGKLKAGLRASRRKRYMNFTVSTREKLLPILINRTVLFFFLMSLFTMFFYLAGTTQGFIDSTQFLLLRLYTILGIFLAFTSASGVILDLSRFIKTKRMRYLLRAGGYAFLVIFGTLTVIIVMAIIALSLGDGV